MNWQLNDVALFVRVAERGSLSAVARERQAPVSQITRALVRLETAVGMRLMHRSTHGLSLTDEGDTFLAHARRMLEASAELQAELTGRLDGPSGWVRLSVSAVVAQAVIAPSLNALMARHPALRLDISADDRLVDMAREGIDVAIRTGQPHSDLLVARQIGVLSRGLYAAPAYLARFGMPRHPGELCQHQLITNSATPALNQWRLGRGREAATYTAQGHVRTDNSATVLALVQAGVGIARLADLAAQALVRSGQLVPVLADEVQADPVPMFAVMLQERQRLPKVRACIDHWAQWLAQARASPVQSTPAGTR